jgi:hypothetical protein
MISLSQHQHLSTARHLPRFLLPLAFSLALAVQAAAPDTLPIHGIHLSAPAKQDLALAEKFIAEALPKEGVNTLILEFDFNYDFQSRPEFADSAALGKKEVRRLSELCREKGINLIPQLNCLGHQSWSKTTGRFLQKHPEFDETPGKYPENKDIYCRSYCPLHPEVHTVLFQLMDELAAACQANAFHVGLDEVFLLADADCPRCKGKSPADVFATEVKTLRDHLKTINCRMWMWGDRYLDGKSTKLGKWEASENDTSSALEAAPRDIVICDWHYDAAPDTARLFASKGFDVVVCPWRKVEPALGQLRQVRALRQSQDAEVSRHALGVVQTTWCGFTPFVRTYEAHVTGTAPTRNAASEAANCFLKLSAAIRNPQ